MYQRRHCFRELGGSGPALDFRKKKAAVFVEHLNHVIPEFLKWPLPILNLDIPTVANVVVNKKKLNGKQCRSWWDGSSRAVSSGYTLFAEVSAFVRMTKRAKYMARMRYEYSHSEIVLREPSKGMTEIIRFYGSGFEVSWSGSQNLELLNHDHWLLPGLKLPIEMLLQSI